jgi:hypothetical protein
MASQHPPKTSAPPGSIDFEVTDFGSARQVLDGLPAGVAEVRQMRPGFWEQQRRRPTPTDRALTGAAMDWVMSLPAELRPHATCERFPRVVNAIAAAWSDTAHRLQVLDHAINDYRGGRRGFPDTVQSELAALHAHHRGRSGG